MTLGISHPFPAQAKRYNQIVAIHAQGPTEEQLQRLRRNFHDPVSRL